MVGQIQRHLAGLCVFADIGQGFLCRTVDHHLLRGGYFHMLTAGVQLGGYAGAALEVLGQPLHGRHQPLVQHGWAQVLHDALAGSQCVFQHLQCRPGMLARLAFGAVADQPGQVKLDGRERAADVVVNLARDTGALLLDAGVQMFGQLGQALFGLGQL
ncbi:hypothetical protein SDC9_138736 [bioreactor metagenome]|uniref:Uncharacterized protein n=1 Tax=bioreactor metagenome TaxID=1076179 RepID=A0A645DQQ8_9ZZZZ